VRCRYYFVTNAIYIGSYTIGHGKNVADLPLKHIDDISILMNIYKTVYLALRLS